MICNFYPKKNNIPIYGLRDSFNFNTINTDSSSSYGVGNYSIYTTVEYDFIVYYNSSSVSASYVVSTNISNSVNILAFDIPDATTIISCPSRTVPIRSSLNCTITPRKNGIYFLFD